jgi:integrase
VILGRSLVQAGRLSTRPYIRMLEENNARQGFVDHAAFLSLRDALPDRLRDPVAFLYLSGWRVSEMRGLEWGDVDLTGHVVLLRPELSKNKTGRVLLLRGDLLDLIERRAQRRRLDCRRVFHVDGHPIGAFRKSWARACVAAGLGNLVPTGASTPAGEPELKYKGLTPHDLRRSAVRNMVRAGIPERVCMALS